MNPENLYRLNEIEQKKYIHQPDYCEGGFHIKKDYTESLAFLKNAPLRFWYNTQTRGYDTHCHSALEIVTPVDQEFTMVVNNITYTINPGDIFLIPSGILHSYLDQKNGARFIYVLKTDFLQSIPGFSYIMSLLTRPVIVNSDTFADIYEEEIGLILQLASDYWQQSPLWEMQVYAGLMKFFSCLGNSCMNRANLEAISLDRQNVSECLDRLFEYVEYHFSEDISLEQAADVAGYSKFYFTRIFKECTGQTFMEYLRSIRISEAEKLLLDNQIPIGTIAFQSGFSSLTTFNRIFRQMKGCAPSEYRNYYAHMQIN